MDTLTIFLLSLPVALLLTWRLLIGPVRQHRDEKRARASTAAAAAYARSQNIGSRQTRYEAKRFQVCNLPCRAALELRNQAFLHNEAPDLPLNECDRPNDCNCRYAKENDRRRKKNRRYPAQEIQAGDDVLLPDSAVLTRDKRTVKDRRKRVTTKPYAGA